MLLCHSTFLQSQTLVHRVYFSDQAGPTLTAQDLDESATSSSGQGTEIFHDAYEEANPVWPSSSNGSPPGQEGKNPSNCHFTDKLC